LQNVEKKNKERKICLLDDANENNYTCIIRRKL